MTDASPASLQNSRLQAVLDQARAIREHSNAQSSTARPLAAIAAGPSRIRQAAKLASKMVSTNTSHKQPTHQSLNPVLHPSRMTHPKAGQLSRKRPDARQIPSQQPTAQQAEQHGLPVAATQMLLGQQSRNEYSTQQAGQQKAKHVEARPQTKQPLQRLPDQQHAPPAASSQVQMGQSRYTPLMQQAHHKGLPAAAASRPMQPPLQLPASFWKALAAFRCRVLITHWPLCCIYSNKAKHMSLNDDNAHKSQ